MKYNFDNNIPIYIQISDIIRLQIVSGKFKPGDKLLSVRQMAIDMEVNPNTIVKAFDELESEKLIYTDRTNGKFVTENKSLIEKIRIKLANEKVSSYLSGMKTLGIDYEEAIAYLERMK